MDTQSNSTPPQSAPQGKNTGMAILAYLGILVVIPFVTEAYKDSFVKFHIKQGLLVLVIWVITGFLHMVPFDFIIALAATVFMVIGIMNAAKGQEKELPYIGHLAKYFNF